MIDLPPPQKAGLHIRRVGSLRAAHLHNHLDARFMEQFHHGAELVRGRGTRAVGSLRSEEPSGSEPPVIDPAWRLLHLPVPVRSLFRTFFPAAFPGLLLSFGRFFSGLLLFFGPVRFHRRCECRCRKRRACDKLPESFRSPSDPGIIRQNLIKFIAWKQYNGCDPQFLQIRNLFRDSKKGPPLLHL